MNFSYVLAHWEVFKVFSSGMRISFECRWRCFNFFCETEKENLLPLDTRSGNLKKVVIWFLNNRLRGFAIILFSYLGDFISFTPQIFDFRPHDLQLRSFFLRVNFNSEVEKSALVPSAAH